MSGGLLIALKALHISALVFWCAGLAALPAMLMRHPRPEDGPRGRRVRRSNRAAYVFLASPAGFLTIATGIALIFTTEVFHPWLFLKLGMVGLMVAAHLQIGRVVMRVSRDHAWTPPPWRLLGILGAAAGGILAVLWLVLAKPDVGTEALPWWLRGPAGVQPEGPSLPLPVPPPLSGAPPAGSSSSVSSSSSSSATMMPI